MEHEHSSTGDCTNPARGRLLLDYALKTLDEDENTSFEAHLLECDVCYANFTAVVRTSSYLSQLVHAAPERLPPAIRFLREKDASNRFGRVLFALALLAIGFLVGLLVARASSAGTLPDIGRLVERTTRTAEDSLEKVPNFGKVSGRFPNTNVAEGGGVPCALAARWKTTTERWT